MECFVEIPYLPKGRVILAVSGFAVAGMDIIPPAELSALPPALRRHADLGLCPIGGREVVCPPDSYPYYCDNLSSYGFSVIQGGQALGGSYPADTAYNVVVTEKFALLDPRSCDGVLLRLLQNRLEILPVKQGYAKCSVAPVGENAFITGDRGIFRALEAKGAEVLLIDNAGVELPPYKNGFFGGACGLVGEKTLAVNGTIRHMSSFETIKAFLADKGVSLVEITAAAPFDTGSLIPLKITDDNNKG